MSAGTVSALQAEGITKSMTAGPSSRTSPSAWSRGELVCLLGVSGAGKTTLFHSLPACSKPEQRSGAA